MLVGVAFLRSKGLIGRDATVNYTGASNQAGTGNQNFDAAHSFPALPPSTPSITELCAAWAVEGCAGSPIGDNRLSPQIFNYADRLFESSGGCDAVIEPIRLIMHDQKQDQPVHDKLVQHATWLKLFPNYLKAYQMAYKLASADQLGIDLLDPAAIDRLNEAALSTTQELDTSRPTKKYGHGGRCLGGTP